jgi:hypothetical protein
MVKTKPRPHKAGRVSCLGSGLSDEATEAEKIASSAYFSEMTVSPDSWGLFDCNHILSCSKERFWFNNKIADVEWDR